MIFSVHFLVLGGCGKREEAVLPTEETIESVNTGNDRNIEESYVDDSESAELEYPALIRVNDYLYYDCAEISTEARCGMMDVTIDSICEGNIPTEDNQTNFGKDYGY